METKILVTGAAEDFGREVLAALSARGIASRAANSCAAIPCAGELSSPLPPMVEAVPFDFAQPETYPAAFTGIERMFVSGFPGPQEIKRSVIPALRAAIQAGVKYIILHSRLDVERLPHSAEYLLERALAHTKISVTFLRCGFPIQSILALHGQEFRRHASLSAPLGAARLGFADRRDLAEVCANALSQPGYNGKVYHLTGPELLSCDDVCRLMGEVGGRKVDYHPVSSFGFISRQLTLDLPLGSAWMAARTYRQIRQGMAGRLYPDLADLLNGKPRPLGAFLEENRSVWAAEGETGA